MCSGRKFTKGNDKEKTRDDTECETLNQLNQLNPDDVKTAKAYITKQYRSDDRTHQTILNFTIKEEKKRYFYAAEILYNLIIQSTLSGTLNSSRVNRLIAENNKKLVWLDILVALLKAGTKYGQAAYIKYMKNKINEQKKRIKQHIADLLTKLKVTDPTPQPPSTTLSPAPAACKKTRTSIIKADEILIRIKKMDNCNINDKQMLEDVTKKYLLDLLSDTDLYKIKNILNKNPGRTTLNPNITRDELLQMIKINLEFFMGSVEIIAKFDDINIKRILDKSIITANLNKDKMGDNIYTILQNIISLKKIKKDLNTTIINTIWENAYDLFPNPYQNVIHDNNSNKIKDPQNAPNSYNDEFEPNLLLNTYKCNNDFVFPSCSKDSVTTQGGTTVEGTSGTTQGGTTVEGTSGTTLGVTTLGVTTLGGTMGTK